MTERSVTERLTRMEDNQIDFKDSVRELKVHLDRQDTKLDRIEKRFDQIDGARKVLWGIWIALAAAISSIATYFGIHHK